MRIAILFALSAAPAWCQNIVDVDLTAAAGTVDLGPGYQNEPALLYDGMLPGPVVRATEGDLVRVRLHNELAVSTILHVHGQPMRLGMDGTQRISRPETAPGQEFLYEFEGLKPGTYWFHPHSDHHHQLDSGLYGVLIVDPANPGDDPPFDVEQMVVLDDWNPAVTGGTFFGNLLNGRTSDGQNDITAQPGQLLRLRFVNAAARTNYVVALDGHQMTVTHKDGYRVQPVTTDAIPLGIGERYDVIVDCSNPGVWSLAASTLQYRAATVVRGVLRYAGQTGPAPAASMVPNNLSNGALLSYAQLASYWPATTPIDPTPDRTYPVALSVAPGPTGMQWQINGESWPIVTPMQVSEGDVVQLDLTTSTPSPNHVHPMHLHGHHVQLMGTAGGTTHPPLMDTILIMPSGQPGDAWSAQFLADNPGRWLYHCHEMHHMMLGMMTLIDYVGDSDGDGRADNDDMEPTLPTPVLTISDQQADFAPGGSGVVSVQWQPNAIVDVFGSIAELPVPMPLQQAGDLRIDVANLAYLGAVVADANGDAALAYSLPANPAFVGARIVLQAVATATMPGGVRLSTHQAFTVR